METIDHKQIEAVLKQIISKHTEESLTAREALEIFDEFFFAFDVKGFPKDEERDMALYQCGLYDWGEGEKFEVDFTRQLSFDEDGEYVGMKQLHLTLCFEPKLATKQVNFDVWYDPNKSKKEWLDIVTQSKGFKIAQNIKTSDFKTGYEDV